MIAVGRQARREPLVACAALALGEAGVCALARRLLELDDARLNGLTVTYGRNLLLVFGEAELLPWADGVQYLGRDASAPRLLVPTAVEPSVPCALFERAVARRCASAKPALAPPWAISLEPELIFSVGHAQPILRARLEALLGPAEAASAPP